MDDTAQPLQSMPSISVKSEKADQQVQSFPEDLQTGQYDYSQLPRISINGELVTLPENLTTTKPEKEPSAFYKISGRTDVSDSLEYYIQLFTQPKSAVHPLSSQSLLLHGALAPFQLLVDEIALRLNAKLFTVSLFEQRRLNPHTFRYHFDELIAQALEYTNTGFVVFFANDIEQLQLREDSQVQEVFSSLLAFLKQRKAFPTLAIVLGTGKLDYTDSIFTDFSYIDKIVSVDKPEDEEGRAVVIETITQELATEKDRTDLFDFNSIDLAKETEGLSFLELENLIKSVLLTKLDQENLNGEFKPVTINDIRFLLPQKEENTTEEVAKETTS